MSNTNETVQVRTEQLISMFDQVRRQRDQYAAALRKARAPKPDPVEQFDAAIRVEMDRSQTDYRAALQKVAADRPDLWAAYVNQPQRSE